MKLNGEKLNRLGYLGISFENSVLHISYLDENIIPEHLKNNLFAATKSRQTAIHIPVNSLSEAENKITELAEKYLIMYAEVRNELIRINLINSLTYLDYNLKKHIQKRYRDDHVIGDSLTSLIPLLRNITNAILEQKDFSDVTMSLKEISEIYQSVADKFKERYEYQKSVNNELYKRDNY